MQKILNKKSEIILVTIAIISLIATYIVGAISNGAGISREVLAQIEGEERRAPISSQMGSVNIKYVDVDGNEIAEATSISGNVGTEYKAERKAIATYAPYGAEPYNKAGNFEKEDQEVVFVYEKEDASVEVSEENNTVTVRTLHERNAKELDIKIITKDENGNLIKGVSYKVTDVNNKTVREGKVQGDTFVVGTVTVADEGEETYTIEEDTNSYYDKLDENPIKFTIKKSWDGSKNEYKADLIHDGYNGVTFDYDKENNQLVIYITNKVNEAENVFDLSIEKYVKKVVVKENGKITKEYNATEEDKENLIKVDIAKKKLEDTKLEVTYGLTIKNVGNVTGSATEVTDYLPDGFTYVSGGEWIVDGNKMVTTDLADIELEAGDSIDLEFVTEWDVNEKEVGLRDNKVEITDYANDLDLDDKTPDNIDTASVMATVKTGGAEVKVGTILLILNIILVGTYLVKKVREERAEDEK